MNDERQRNALLSVFNKDEIVPFAEELVELGFNIYSSGGTARVLREAGVPVTDVAQIIAESAANLLRAYGVPEDKIDMNQLIEEYAAILDHRVVTLSREVHGGLLAQYDVHVEEMEALGLPYIDMVVNDVYPLKAEIAKPDCTLASVIEQTDIGGPTMQRSAAKGQRIVVCKFEDRQLVIDWLRDGEPNREQFIEELAATTEAYVADYCLASARFRGKGQFEGIIGELVTECQYGENGWQTPAGLYAADTDDPLAVWRFELVAGTAPSYNNTCDIDRLLQTATHIVAGFQSVSDRTGMFTVVAAKHGNPCGASIYRDPVIATRLAIDGDKRAVFGGLVMLDFVVNEEIATELISHNMPEGQRRLLDGIIAPAFTPDAIEILRRKGDRCRLLANQALLDMDASSLDSATRLRPVRGGFLAQPNYTVVPEADGLRDSEYAEDLMLAWAIGSTSNSNTVTLVRANMLLGNGVGQQDRVGCAELAVKRAVDAGHYLPGTVAYSDSFFPFVDAVEVLAAAGIQAILTSSGSVRDDEVRAFCDEREISLFMVPDREARGFFGH